MSFFGTVLHSPTPSGRRHDLVAQREGYDFTVESNANSSERFNTSAAGTSTPTTSANHHKSSTPQGYKHGVFQRSDGKYCPQRYLPFNTHPLSNHYPQPLEDVCEPEELDQGAIAQDWCHRMATTDSTMVCHDGEEDDDNKGSHPVGVVQWAMKKIKNGAQHAVQSLMQLHSLLHPSPVHRRLVWMLEHCCLDETKDRSSRCKGGNENVQNPSTPLLLSWNGNDMANNPYMVGHKRSHQSVPPPTLFGEECDLRCVTVSQRRLEVADVPPTRCLNDRLFTGHPNQSGVESKTVLPPSAKKLRHEPSSTWRNYWRDEVGEAASTKGGSYKRGRDAAEPTEH